MVYAPVIITTLSRHKHLKDCLESLEKCTWAEKTDVFVAVDFPPSIKYEQGWKLVCDYLNYKENHHHFNRLNVIRRPENYGIIYPTSNSARIISQVKESYDRYIFTEDDNLFSPNFLVFLNKGLEKFKDDERVSYICGYNYPAEFPESYTNNWFISKHSSPWGYGTWSYKERSSEDYYKLDYLKNLIIERKSRSMLFKHNPSTVYSIVDMIRKDMIFEDSCKGAFLCFEDRYSIFPRLSKVKNVGIDGSGVNSKGFHEESYLFYNSQEMDTLSDFSFTDDIFTFEPLLIHRYAPPKRRIRAYFKTLFFKLYWMILRITNLNF